MVTFFEVSDPVFWGLIFAISPMIVEVTYGWFYPTYNNVRIMIKMMTIILFFPMIKMMLRFVKVPFRDHLANYPLLRILFLFLEVVGAYFLGIFLLKPIEDVRNHYRCIMATDRPCEYYNDGIAVTILQKRSTELCTTITVSNTCPSQLGSIFLSLYILLIVGIGNAYIANCILHNNAEERTSIVMKTIPQHDDESDDDRGGNPCPPMTRNGSQQDVTDGLIIRVVEGEIEKLGRELGRIVCCNCKEAIRNTMGRNLN